MGSEAMLQLSNGHETVVDPEDLERIRRWHWHAHKGSNALYAARTTSRWNNGTRKVLIIYLHRFLVNAPAGMQVDHINHDSLDNRKKNLEIVMPAENLRRRRCEVVR